MPIYNTLVEIAEQAEIQSSCQGNVEEILQRAAARGVIGRILLVKPKQGYLTRMTKDTKLKIANWHEAALFSEDGLEYVVDIDCPFKVCTITEYSACFPNPDNVQLGYIEES